ERPTGCSAKPIDAAIVDNAFVGHLSDFLGDVGAWRDRLVESREVDRAKLTSEVRRAEKALAKVGRSVEGLEAKLAECSSRGDGEGADICLRVIGRQEEERERAERRLEAART